MRTLIAVSALVLLAFASGCASSSKMDASAPTTTTGATVDPRYNPPSDGYVFFEQPAVEAAPRSETAPVHLAAPNHEAPTGHVHAATN